MLAEWIEIGKSLATGVGLSIPVIGALVVLHKSRGEAQNMRFDRLDESHGELRGKVETLNTDVDGLTRQLSGIVNDVEKRFLTREEGTAAINRLDSSVTELNRTITTTVGELNRQLFDLARGRPGNTA